MSPNYVQYTFLCWTVVILTLHGAQSALAEMVFLSADRSLTTIGTQLESMQKEVDGFEPLNTEILNSGYVRDANNKIVGSTVASATQVSTITEDEIRGLGRSSGYANGLDGVAIGTGRTEMTVSFEVDEVMNYTLSGQLRIVHGIGLNGSVAQVRLTGPEGIVFDITMDDANPPDNTGVLDFSGSNRLTGEFGPGVFTLEAMSEGNGTHGLNRCADFEFTLTTAVVPEPASLMLLMLAAFIGCHRLRCAGKAIGDSGCPAS